MYINHITSKLRKFRSQILAFFLSTIASFSLIYYLHNKSPINKPSVVADIFGWLILEIAYIFILYIFFKKKGQIYREIFIFLLIEISFFALKTRLLLPPIPFGVIDHYPDITVNFYKYAQFSPSHRAPYYPLIFFLFTYLSGSFSAIIIAQVFFSILSIILFVIIILRVGVLINSKVRVLNNNFYYLFALIAFFLLSLSNRRVEYEFSIRPESLSQFIEILILFFIFKIIKNKKHLNKYLIMVVVVSLFSIFFQVKFLFLGIFNILIVFFLILFSNNSLKKKNLKIVFFVMIPIISFLSLNSILNTYMSTDAKKEFEYNSFYVRNQKTISKVIINDFNDANFNKYNKKTLKKFIDYYNTNSHFYPNNDTMSIYGFDYISFSQKPTFINFAWSVLPDYSQRVGFLKYYLQKSVIDYPLDYFINYFYELKRVYNPLSPMFFNQDYNLFFSKEIDSAKEIFREYYGTNSKIAIIENYLNTDSNSYYYKDSIGVFMFINPLRKIINFLYLPSMFTFIILFFTTWFRSKKIWVQYKKLSWLVLYSTIAAFLMYSVTCFGHLYLNRYIDEIFPLFLASEILAIIYVISVLFQPSSSPNSKPKTD